MMEEKKKREKEEGEKQRESKGEAHPNMVFLFT